MGYKIVYRPVRKLHRAGTLRTGVGALTGVFLFVFLLLVNLFWAEGMLALREVFLPSGGTIASSAMEDLSLELKQSGSVGTVLEEFWRIVQQTFDASN